MLAPSGKNFENMLSLDSWKWDFQSLLSVTRYFAGQLLNKHAKNYQSVEKITKFLLSAKVV
jgi:hypothetical protein